MAQPSTSLIITPVLPKGQSVRFGMVGAATFGPASNGSSGGLQIVDRPRQKAATQWYDASPMEYMATLILDGGAGIAASVEPQCAAVNGWLYPKPGQQQPPVLAISGPVSAQAKGLYWQLYTVKFDDDKAIRDASGARTQVNLTLTLYEYVPTTASVLTHQSPAQVAQVTLASNGAAVSRRTYTVRKGDTLASIAGRQLGDWTQGTNIALLNGIRDGRSIKAGQTILLPSS